LDNWREQYKKEPEVLERINAYFHRGNKVSMKIISYRDTSIMYRKEIEKEIGRFIVPQGFYYLDDTELLKELERKLILDDVKYNDETKFIATDHICKEYGLHKK